MMCGGAKTLCRAKEVFFPPGVWRHIRALGGGREFWLDRYRAAVVPCLPRAAYGFSFVGVRTMGDTMYVTRYNRSTVRPGLRRRGPGGAVRRGRRPRLILYEVCQVEARPAPSHDKTETGRRGKAPRRPGARGGGGGVDAQRR